ncbi:hypothetical protein B4099_0867 [Heyndrickxia coagulans]|uniref:Uncharacterized protein n=1 Tax=Heyndrickxia coagulans TaxID=1398 RepID=A0A150KE92_HEYCO|nr:hypothetical protein B4099_0867 [Heyndrickxia coagulans]
MAWNTRLSGMPLKHHVDRYAVYHCPFGAAGAARGIRALI